MFPKTFLEFVFKKMFALCAKLSATSPSVVAKRHDHFCFPPSDDKAPANSMCSGN